MTRMVNISDETGIQKAVIAWTQQPEIRKKWPELAMLYHVPNEGKRTGRQGQTLHDAGLKRGVPDLCLPVARGGYHGLYIEMKTEKGRPSDPQKWWIEHLKLQGYYATVCHGYSHAILTLEWYMGLTSA